MHLLRVEALEFRNLSGPIDFANGLNVLYGDNAQGKSNWLEAVYLLSTTRSFRTVHPREMIRHGSAEAILRGVVSRGTLTRELQLLIGETTKQAFISGKREPVTRYLGSLDAIAFTADEMEVVRGAPEARRRFLDRGIIAIQPSFLATITEYGKVLKQKNKLLRDFQEMSEPDSVIPLIEVWNDQLATLGTEIHESRVAYVEKLRKGLLPQLFKCEKVEISYRSSLEGKGNTDLYESLLRERLGLRLRNELAAGYALVGPHRDDVDIRCDGYDVARFGSAGQQRSALLILDLAQMLVYYDVYDEYPVFLIDDIDAELDRTRIEILLDYLGDKSQTIVSTSKRTLADRYRDRATVRLIANGFAAVPEAGVDGIRTTQDDPAVTEDLQYQPPF